MKMPITTNCLAIVYVFAVATTSWAGAVVAISGDYDLSGHVDAVDASVWAAEFGTAGGPFSGADGNGDGLIDQADYTIVFDNLGHTGKGLMEPAPPGPTSALLVYDSRTGEITIDATGTTDGNIVAFKLFSAGGNFQSPDFAILPFADIHAPAATTIVDTPNLLGQIDTTLSGLPPGSLTSLGGFLTHLGPMEFASDLNGSYYLDDSGLNEFQLVYIGEPIPEPATLVLTVCGCCLIWGSCAGFGPRRV